MRALKCRTIDYRAQRLWESLTFLGRQLLVRVGRGEQITPHGSQEYRKMDALVKKGMLVADTHPLQLTPEAAPVLEYARTCPAWKISEKTRP